MATQANRRPRKVAVRFFTGPITVWKASRAIALTTLVVTLAGGLVAWLIDHSEFPNIGESMWWSLQTVTTVGYGDVVPENVEGRIVGSVLMIAGVGFLAVITASIAAAFTQMGMRRLRQSDQDPLAERIEELISRVDRLEETVRRSTGPKDGGD